MEVRTMGQATLHDGTEWTEARGFDMLRTLTPPTDPTTPSARHYGWAQADSRRSEVEALVRGGMTRTRAVWVALTDEVAVRGTLSSIADARVFADALGVDLAALGTRDWRGAGHEQGQRYVDTGSCGCLLCLVFSEDEVADAGIDLEATIAHAGSGQPDWATDEALEAYFASLPTHVFVLDADCVGTVCHRCEDEQPTDRPCPADSTGRHAWVEVEPCRECGLTLHAELTGNRKAHRQATPEGMTLNDDGSLAHPGCTLPGGHSRPHPRGDRSK
jgi:hypothetical protein